MFSPSKRSLPGNVVLFQAEVLGGCQGCWVFQETRTGQVECIIEYLGGEDLVLYFLVQ